MEQEKHITDQSVINANNAANAFRNEKPQGQSIEVLPTEKSGEPRVTPIGGHPATPNEREEKMADEDGGDTDSKEAEKAARLRYDRQERYDKKNTERISLKLNKRTDSDILAWIEKSRESSGSKQGAIRKALKEYINTQVLP